MDATHRPPHTDQIDTTRLRIVPLPDAQVRRWGEDVVVYDHRSGETHLLPGAVGALFLWWRLQPRRPAELPDHLREVHYAGIDDPDPFARRVVEELRRLQLLEPLTGVDA